MVKYQKLCCHFPLKIPRGPSTGLVSKYKKLHLDAISNKTWVAINTQATMRRQGHLTTLVTHWMGCEIKSLLAADCKQRAANTASTIKNQLSNSAVKEAWCTLKGWYRLA